MMTAGQETNDIFALKNDPTNEDSQKDGRIILKTTELHYFQ